MTTDLMELKVPMVGESVTEVVIGEWIKPKGSRVDQDEPVVTLETDKVNVDLPAPVRGVVTEVLKKSGETARVGEVIGYMQAGDGRAAEKEAIRSALPRRASSRPAARAPAPVAEVEVKAPDAKPPEPVAISDDGERAERLTPSQRREARQKEIRGELEPPAVPPARELRPKEEAKTERGEAAPRRGEEIVPMTPLRRRIAERLVQAQQSGAHLTTFNEVDLSEVIALRKSYQDNFRQKHGIKLGFMSFFIKATIEALKDLPVLNAEIRGTDIIYRSYYDIGVAVGGGRGLVVPVMRNAERLSFAEIETTLSELADRARAGKLKLEELEGGTFTITNGGIYGSMLSTPIINPPQSGILGMHKIEDRAVVRSGQITIRPMMYLALTYDHRLVDGREAVTFLLRIKECLESPTRILLEL